MKNISKALLPLFLIFSMNAIQADDHVISYGMEGYQCNVAEGKDMDDVVKFAEKTLNPYADENWSAP